jgi:S1-C subfamily serine protease
MSRPTCVVAAAAVLALGGAATGAPVPPERPPDPLARSAVGVTADTSTLVVSEVYANMPAGKAGVRVGDRIVRVGNLHPRGFDQVIAQICSYRPGSQIEFEVERGGERIVFKMKLVPRPDSFGSIPLPGSPPPLGGPPDP